MDGHVHPEQHEALQAHIAAGWLFEDGQKIGRVIAPTEVPHRLPTDHLQAQGSAYGLTTCLDTCALWGVTGCHPKGEVGMALWQLMGTLSAARLCAAVLQSSAWAAAVVRAVVMSLQRLQQAMRATKGPWLNRKRKLSHHASSLISSMLEALQRCRATCQAAQAAPTLSAEHAVHLSADLDLAYYSLLEHHLSCGHPVPPVPPPHSYFPALAQAHPGNAAAVKQLVRERAGSYGKEVLRRVWGVRKAGGALELPTQAAADNPLLAVMWARFQESCRLFYASGLALEGALDKVACEEDARIASRAPRVGGMQRSAPFGGAKRRRVSALNTSESSSTSWSAANTETESSDTDSEDGALHEVEAWPCEQSHVTGARLAVWPADAALSRWRDASRECHLYAYAPPTSAALELLSALGHILEVGAGVGYWALKLREMGVYVMASDLHPPGDSSRNLWHRSIPLMTEVTQGGVESVTVAPPPHTLLLCYPPSDSSMASDCLKAYRGHTVCFVGEWCGDTGDPAFLHQLQSHFTLLERRALPNWSDTSHELTVWQKRSEPMFEAGPDGVAEDCRALACNRCGCKAQTGSNRSSAAHDQHSKRQLPAGQKDQCKAPMSARQKHHSGSAKLKRPRLRRCCYCRQAVYCCGACADADAARHAEMHAMRMLFFRDRRLNFWNPVDFEVLDL